MSAGRETTAWRAAELPQARPLDEANTRWLHAVRPPGWVNPAPAERYNLVVIGGGTAGLVAAVGAVGLGARVALIERDLLGGDCLNTGCVPSKALLRAARAAADVRDAARFGIRVPAGTAADFAAVMARLRELRARISPHDSAERLRALGVDVFFGGAAFTAPDTVEVDGQRLRFARACIATGARPAVPSIPGLAAVGSLTHETVFALEALPRRLAVIGAGAVGCELAQAFARFGSAVALVELMPRVLPGEDAEASAVVRAALERDGVRVLCRAGRLAVARDGRETRLALEVAGEPVELRVDALLVATGRTPNVEGLGLEAAGVAYDRGGVLVNDRLQTSNRRIYAAGDVCSRQQFTHAADAQARVVIQNALFFGRRRASALIVPRCTYTDPEVAHVGLLPEEAAARGLAIDTFTMPLGANDRAILDGEADGFLRVHTRRRSGRIVGATLVSRHAGESISTVTLAMTTGAGLGTVARVIHPYPTQAEVIRQAADAYIRTWLTPRVRRVVEVFLRWRR